MENSWVHSLAGIVILFNISALTLSTTTDQLALLALKNTITWDPHALLTRNWSTDTSVCNWIGVVCDVNPQRVTTLKLSRFDLGGTIPPQIGDLAFLRSLDISFNNFSGTIPSQLCNLRRLEEFNAGVNSFGGEIPEELQKLTSLISIDLRHNSLKGSIPWSIFNISTLKMLQLSFNQFEGTLPANMGMGMGISLERLYMNGNKLSGPIPSSIINASKLTVLEMARNSFTGPIPNFGDLRLLRVLRIQGNNLTGAESTTQELSFLSSLTTSRYLQVLDVSENPLNGVLPAPSIANLSTSLVQFWATKCNINGVIPPEIGILSGLVGLYLYENRLQGNIPHNLCQMSSLAELDLSSNMLTGPIPECFGEVGSLRKINLGSNNLNSTIPSSFWDLNNLLILNLSSNYLSGSLSTQIGNLKAIYRMDLSSNQFVGDIPSSLDSCQSLETLYLSNNMLTGSIPQSLGSVGGLSRLDLSNNNLSGLIPRSLERIRCLEHFNVSYNSLDGEIPNEGPFVNFTAQSFVHNSAALCGSTRFQVSPCMRRTRERSKDVGRFVAYIVASFISVIIWVIGVFLSVIFVIIIKDSRKPPQSIDDQTSLGVELRMVSYGDLMQVTGGFGKTNLLGSGGYSSVYKGTLPNGLSIAVKVFNLELEAAARSFVTETEILSSIRHRNLMRVLGCCASAKFRALVLAYMPNGSLEELLYSDTYCLDLVQRLNIAVDVASALEYLHHHHTSPIVHCDIKPSNVLLDQHMTAQLSDFGVAKVIDKAEADVQPTTFRGTIGYAPPEYGFEGSVTIMGDVYSYGIMLLELFTRKKPTDDMFNGETSLKSWVGDAIETNAIRKVVDTTLLSTIEDQPFLPKVLLSVFYLAMKCLDYSPYYRINMTEAAFILQKIKANVDSEMTRNSSPYYSIAESPPPLLVS